MYILIVEDDLVQYNFIEDFLKKDKQFSGARVERIVTESEFRKKLGEIATDKPDIIIMDVMIRWTDPSPNIEIPPKEISEEGFYRAGIRCVKMLNDDNRTKDIPIIVYSVLERDDIDDDLKKFSSHVTYITKDFNARKIITSITHSLRK